jgi:NTP pyrophosphatase (non-canonical NTP hydrolase)
MQTEEYTERIYTAFPVNSLSTNVLAICAESGEVAHILKKKQFAKDMGIEPEEGRDELIEELSDVLFHVAQAAKNLGSSLNELMETGVAKTEKRNNS